MKAELEKKRKYIVVVGSLFVFSVLVSLAIFLFCRIRPGTVPAKATEIEIDNREETVESVRHGLRNHARQITVSFLTKGDATDLIGGLAAGLVEEALAETEDPAGGDYIRFQYGGYELRYSHERTKTGYLYTVRIIPDYYTYLVQEEEVNQWISEIMHSFHFSENTSEYKKIRTIYEYVYDNVSYDKVHKEKSSQHLKTTVYAALKYRTAVCQGYAVLMYRLLREAGIRTRVITGDAQTDSGETEFHAWNLVELEGFYYNLDVTLDKAEGTNDFFLRADGDFPRHERADFYRTPEFMRDYPMAEKSY